MPHYQGKYSEEKCAILGKDVELLWKKVSVCESYGDSERKLRNKAVEALNQFKNQITEMEGESVERHQWEKPKVMMMRAASVEEA